MSVLSIQINYFAGTTKHNNYKRHDKLGYSSIVTLDLRSDVCHRRKSTGYGYRGDIGKLTYNITTPTYSPVALVVFVIHTISYICEHE